MPDLQSELSKIASAWDAHENMIRQPAQHTHQEKAMEAIEAAVEHTGNLSRDIFNHARKGVFTREQLNAAMESVGYKRTSITSLITQMLRAKLLEERDLRLYPLRAEYKPLSLYKAHTPRPARKAAGLAAIPVKKEEAPVAPVVQDKRMTAASVMASMNVAEAYKLYVELHAMFGSK
jgi:hypothetical protein